MQGEHTSVTYASRFIRELQKLGLVRCSGSQWCTFSARTGVGPGSPGKQRRRAGLAGPAAEVIPLIRRHRRPLLLLRREPREIVGSGGGGRWRFRRLHAIRAGGGGGGGAGWRRRIRGQLDGRRSPQHHRHRIVRPAHIQITSFTQRKISQIPQGRRSVTHLQRKATNDSHSRPHEKTQLKRYFLSGQHHAPRY